jgi:hypothetical protein
MNRARPLCTAFSSALRLSTPVSARNAAVLPATETSSAFRAFSAASQVSYVCMRILSLFSRFKRFTASGVLQCESPLRRYSQAAHVAETRVLVDSDVLWQKDYPKRPVSAYIRFSNEKRASVQGSVPGEGQCPTNNGIRTCARVRSA